MVLYGRMYIWQISSLRLMQIQWSKHNKYRTNYVFMYTFFHPFAASKQWLFWVVTQARRSTNDYFCAFDKVYSKYEIV